MELQIDNTQPNGPELVLKADAPRAKPKLRIRLGTGAMIQRPDGEWEVIKNTPKEYGLGYVEMAFRRF